MNIIKKTCPNYSTGRTGYRPEAIVIHVMDGTLVGTDSWFANPQSNVSAHYGIGKIGEIHNYVVEENTAWHAGRINTPSWKLIKRTINGDYINPNLYTIGIEHEGTVDSDWPETMYQSSGNLIAQIAAKWNIPIDRQHVIGHHEIYALKPCPGNKVDMSKLIAVAIGDIKTHLDAIANPTPLQGSGLTICALNMRFKPNRDIAPVYTVNKGTVLNYVGYSDQGENINKVSKWYCTEDGFWFWGGGVENNSTVDQKH